MSIAFLIREANESGDDFALFYLWTIKYKIFR